VVGTEECAVTLQLCIGINSSSDMVLPVLPSAFQHYRNPEMQFRNPDFAAKLWSSSSVVYSHFHCGCSGTDLCQKNLKHNCDKMFGDIVDHCKRRLKPVL
jgi:hypothetical protein